MDGPAGARSTAGVRIDGADVGAAADHPPGGGRRARLTLAAALAMLVAFAAAVEHWRVDAVAGQGRGGLVRSVDPCPIERSCAISPQPSERMTAAADQAFPGYTRVSTTVLFDAGTGATSGQSMTLTKDGIVVSLTVSRDLWSQPREMLVDVTSASSDGVVVTAVPADGVVDRMSTAALSGPDDVLLPVDAAILWATTLDLFGDGPR